MKRIYLLIICLLLSVGGCEFGNSLEQTSWIHGKWISIGRSKDTVKRDKSPAPGHVVFFTRNGKIKRYSKDTGWKLIKGFFKTKDSVLKMRVLEDFRDMGQLRKDGKLIMNFSKGRYILYEPLPDNTKVEELNIVEELPIIDIN